MPGVCPGSASGGSISVMGTIYRQAGRTVYMLKYYQNGRAIFESSGTDSWDEAADKLRSIEGKIADGKPAPGRANKMRFEEVVKHIEHDYQANGRKSIRELRARLRMHLIPFFKGKRFGKITSPDVSAYVAARLDEGAANATVNRELAALKRMYSLASEEVSSKPTIKMLAENNIRTGFFERPQFVSVQAHLPDYLRPLVTVAYWTGWRMLSELQPMRWHQVDETAKILRLDVGTTKNKKGRTFPYGELPEVAAAVQACRLATDQAKKKGTITPFVFHRDGQPIKDFRAPWRDACLAAGCPGRIRHDFRRTAVRNLVRAGVSEHTAMLLTGHRTNAVFKRYDIVDEADLTTATARLQAATVSATVSATSASKKRRR